MILIILIIACIVLYKTGAAARFLNGCKLDEDPRQAAPPEETPKLSEREQLEIDAGYIITIQGKTDPATVKYMSDELLQAITRDYLQANEII